MQLRDNSETQKGRLLCLWRLSYRAINDHYSDVQLKTRWIS